MRLVIKLLRSRLSFAQLAGFVTANLAGMAIVLAAVQAYRDVSPIFSQSDSFPGNDYLIISKKVATGGAGNHFSRAELDELAAKPFIADMGEFTPAAYKVTGRISAAGTELSTDLFFEAIPDRFLDVRDDAWVFREGDRIIPVILPRNYLNLYNFGFAPSHGLPQISPELFGLVTFELNLSGNGRYESFKGRVSAFSNRINTILVPQSFIEWSNAALAPGAERGASRIIIEVVNSADADLHGFLREKGYETEGEKGDGGRISYFLRMAAAAVAGVGALITALSLFVLMLSIFLLLQKNTRKLENLLLLGYSAARVSLPYQILTLTLNLLVFTIAMTVTVWIRSLYMPRMEFLMPGYEPVGVAFTAAIGLGIVFFATAVNCIAIRRKVNSLRRSG